MNLDGTYYEVEEDPRSRWWVESGHEDYDLIDDFLCDIYYDCIVTNFSLTIYAS